MHGYQVEIIELTNQWIHILEAETNIRIQFEILHRWKNYLLIHLQVIQLSSAIQSSVSKCPLGLNEAHIH